MLGAQSSRLVDMFVVSVAVLPRIFGMSPAVPLRRSSCIWNTEHRRNPSSARQCPGEPCAPLAMVAANVWPRNRSVAAHRFVFVAIRRLCGMADYRWMWHDQMYMCLCHIQHQTALPRSFGVAGVRPFAAEV